MTTATPQMERTPQGVAPRAFQGVAALVLLAAPSATVVATVYGYYFRDRVADAGRYSLATAIVTPIVIFASLGLRTMLLSRSRLDLAAAHGMRLFLIVPTIAVAALIAALAAPEALLLTSCLALLRSLDALAEIGLALAMSRDEHAAVVARGCIRLGAVLLVTVGLIASGVGALGLVVAQVTVALGWYVVIETRHLPPPRWRRSAEAQRELVRLLPLGVAGLASVGAFSLPRVLSAPHLDGNELGLLAAATTAPLIVSGAVGSLVESVLGGSIPQAHQRRWTAKWMLVGAALAAPVLVVVAVISSRAAGFDPRAFTYTAIAGAAGLAVISTVPNIVLHRRERFQAIWLGRIVGLGTAASITVAAPARHTLEGVAVGLLAGQAVTIAAFTVGLRHRGLAALRSLEHANRQATWARTVPVVLVSPTIAFLVWRFCPGLAHWSTLVVLADLVLASWNLRRALRCRHGLFDPWVWMEAYSVYFFAIAPLLHVVLRYSIEFPDSPTDLRPWLGRAALLNFFALAGHALLMTKVARRRRQTVTSAASTSLAFGAGIDAARRLMVLSSGALAVTVLLVGGPAAYLAQSLARLDGFKGLGAFVLLSDLLPIAIVTSVAISGWRSGLSRGAVRVLTAAMTLQLLLSGLRGSRIQIVFSGIVCIGLLHGAGMKLRRSTLAVLAVAAVAFSYAYTAYKDSGIEAVTGEARSGIDRSVGVLLLGDFGRSDVQALLLWHEETDQSLPHAWGRTYVDDAMVHVPSAFRPALVGWSKVDYGTRWMIGSLPDGFRIGNIYGAAGEAVLNFGALAFIPALVLRSLLSRAILLRLDRERRRGRPVFLITPFLCILLITMLMSDLDQVVYMTIRFGLVPLVVYRQLVSVRTPTRKAGHAPQPPAELDQVGITATIAPSGIAEPRS